MRQDCALLDVTVLGAINLPERKGLASYAGLSPFCRLKLGESGAETHCGSGRNPTWAVTKQLQWAAGASELTLQVYDASIRKQTLLASGTKRLLPPANRTKWDETVVLTSHIHSGTGGQVQLELGLIRPHAAQPPPYSSAPHQSFPSDASLPYAQPSRQSFQHAPSSSVTEPWTNASGVYNPQLSSAYSQQPLPAASQNYGLIGGIGSNASYVNARQPGMQQQHGHSSSTGSQPSTWVPGAHASGMATQASMPYAVPQPSNGRAHAAHDHVDDTEALSVPDSAFAPEQATSAEGVPGTPPQHTHRKGSRRMKSILNRIRGKHKQDRDGSSVGPSGAQVLREDQGVDMSDGEAPAGPHTIDLPAEGDSMDSADDTVSGMESQASALTEPNQSSGTMSDTRPSRHSRHSSSERETPLARVSTRSQVANGAPAAEPLQAEFLPPSSPFSQEAIPEQAALPPARAARKITPVLRTDTAFTAREHVPPLPEPALANPSAPASRAVAGPMQTAFARDSIQAQAQEPPAEGLASDLSSKLRMGHNSSASEDDVARSSSVLRSYTPNAGNPTESPFASAEHSQSGPQFENGAMQLDDAESLTVQGSDQHYTAPEAVQCSGNSETAGKPPLLGKPPSQKFTPPPTGSASMAPRDERESRLRRISGRSLLQVSPIKDTWEIKRDNLHILKRPGTDQLWELGEGAFGKVYKGTRGAEPVAIKVVTGQNDRAVKDFRREVQTLMSLHCTYIVQFLGACITSNEMMLVTELLQESLCDALSHERMTWKRGGNYVAYDIAGALEYLHSHNTWHLDVKSPNILLTGSNKPYAKLADLGLARMPAVYAASMMDDTLKGTFAWLAPELILNTMNHEVSEKADMYSFGVVLWEITTGERPRRGFLRSIQSPEDAPADIAGLAVDCMHHDPTQRPSAREVREALMPHVTGKPRSARGNRAESGV